MKQDKDSQNSTPSAEDDILDIEQEYLNDDADAAHRRKYESIYGDDTPQGADRSGSAGARRGNARAGSRNSGSERRTGSAAGPDRRAGTGHGRRRRRQGVNAHAVLWIVIAAIAAAAGIRLYLWNRGEKSTYDPSAVNTNYDIEVQDIITAQDPKVLEGRTDDGRTTILFLGDDPISDDTGDTGIAGRVKALGGDNVDVMTAAFPGSQVACKNATYSTSYVDDAFNFYYVCSSISLGDYTAMSNAASLKTDSDVYASSVKTLQGVDFNTVDVIAVMYDAVDYLNGSPVYNTNDTGDLQTYAGALERGFSLIRDKYPWIRLVFLSPTYALYVDADGKQQPGDTYDAGNGTLPTYWTKAIDACSAAETVSFIDNYYGSVNADNYKDYLADNIHLNAAGFDAVARHFVSKILEGSLDEYNADAAASDADTAASE
ncbi:MAG: hypothetical protein LKJ76_05185 [Lachnospiraceae bacterium]|jgi:hypothetical protein|nr:hypothetical protein [Lachnospiraceae bacterium]